MDAKKLYYEIKSERYNIYNEELHCTLLLEVMNKEGTMAAFCKRANISSGYFSQWTRRYPVFAQCYEIGKVISRANWEAEGQKGKTKKDFNLNYWRLVGACRYGVSSNRIRVAVDPEATPYTQYKQLMLQASNEEFNASEIKQLMESINVGIRAYESYELQNQVNEVKGDLERMKLNDANNRIPTENITEKN